MLSFFGGDKPRDETSRGLRVHDRSANTLKLPIKGVIAKSAVVAMWGGGRQTRVTEMGVGDGAWTRTQSATVGYRHPRV